MAFLGAWTLVREVLVKPIFEYLDYRQFLADLVADRVAKGMSYRAISFKMGFRSAGYAKRVIEGHRSLTPTSILAIADFCKMRGAEREFFQNLVLMNQAKTAKEKHEFYAKLTASKKYVAQKHVERDQCEYFNKWYYAAVRELVQVPGFRNNPTWIARTLVPHITESQAREAMELLGRLGLIRRSAEGTFEQVDTHIGTPPQVAEAAAYVYHREMLGRAQESIDLWKSTHREVTALTLTMSPAQFQKARRKLRELKNEINAECAAEPDPQAVYQFNIQLFPLSEVPYGKK